MDDDRARIAVRDQLLDGIVGHLRKRDPPFAKLVERIIGVVRAQDHRIEESRLAADIEAFAKMTLSRGKTKPAGKLRKVNIKLLTTTGHLRAELDGHTKPGPSEWAEAIDGAWRDCLMRRRPLQPMDRKWVLRGRRLEDKAMRLVFLATYGVDAEKEFGNVRKRVKGHKLRAHPWSD